MKFFTVLTIYFLSFRIFEQLMFALKFLTVLNILFTFRIFEKLALALKNRACLEFTRLVWPMVQRMKALYFISLGK